MTGSILPEGSASNGGKNFSHAAVIAVMTLRTSLGVSLTSPLPIAGDLIVAPSLLKTSSTFPSMSSSCVDFAMSTSSTRLIAAVTDSHRCHA